MTTTNENIEVQVPGVFIKNKAVDFDAEVYAAMGGSLPIGGFLVRPPSLGVFSLMETYESKFISDPAACSVMEFWRVLYINEHRQACMQEVMEWAYPDKGGLFDAEDSDSWQFFDWAVHEWGTKLDLTSDVEGLVEPFLEVHKWFSLSFEGFDMIPGASSGGSEYWFGADAIGSLSTSLAQSVETLLWHTPMCCAGHQLAAICKQNGNEHIARKKDPEDAKKQFDDARERVRNGEFHPWQLQDPEMWPVDAMQVKHNPKLIDAWEALVKEKKDGRR
jgi:hypothetical protein